MEKVGHTWVQMEKSCMEHLCCLLKVLEPLPQELPKCEYCSIECFENNSRIGLDWAFHYLRRCIELRHTFRWKISAKTGSICSKSQQPCTCIFSCIQSVQKVIKLASIGVWSLERTSLVASARSGYATRTEELEFGTLLFHDGRRVRLGCGDWIGALKQRDTPH